MVWSYTFHLREDVKFHDGTRFDVAAVKFNLDRIKDPKNVLYALSDIGDYRSSQVVDDFTVRALFTKPYAPFLANLSKSSFGIVSPAAVQKYGDQFPLHPVGTGPFRFTSMAPGTEIALERNPDYGWGPSGAAHEGPAWLEKLTFKNVPEEATRVAVLENGQAGAVDLVPPQNLVELRSSSKFHVIERELLNSNYSLYLNALREPWSDERVRRAFRLSLGVDGAVKTIYLGTAARAWSPLSPSILGYDRALEGGWKQDRAAATQALDELGWKPGPDGIRVKDSKRLTVAFLDTQGNREKRLDLMTIFRRQLHDSGFELKVDTEFLGSWIIEASRAAGASHFAILRRHILPHCSVQILVMATLGVGGSILVGSGLSFLGHGVSDERPDWGYLLTQGRSYLTVAWWTVTYPGLAITALVIR